ncbi:MAG TPA: hypothetical protein VER03_18925 [Bryobacteraceae bacterium]|nr:hypothetical protein [Bryobacteraceae bacterium]
MTLVRKTLPLLLALSLDALAVDKDKNKFTPPDLDTLQTKLTVSDVTVGAAPYERPALAQAAFGKVNPYEHGILPVLVIIRNGSKGAIRLDAMRVEYHDRDRQVVSAIPATEVAYAGGGPKRPTFGGPSIPGLGGRGKKNPLSSPEIEQRSFAAKMLPPGDTAYGFFYFRTGHRSGAQLYLTGMQEAATGKDIFYFEIPLD